MHFQETNPPCNPALGLGDFSVPFVFLKWEHQGGKRRKSQQAASQEPAARGGWSPRRQDHCSEPGAWARRQAPSVVQMETSQTALCRPAGIWGRPVSCNAHTPTGLRAVRLVPKANTELIFPAYSFHVWAASGFSGSLGSLLPASLKPPGPLRLAGSWSPLPSTPKS